MFLDSTVETLCNRKIPKLNWLTIQVSVRQGFSDEPLHV